MLDTAAVQAITLDLDDTLWPVWPTIHRAEAALAQWLQGPAPGAAATLADSQQRARLRQQVLAERPDLQHDLSHQRLALIRLALQGSGEDVALALPAFEVFYEHRNRVDLYDDALPALQRLSARYPLAALSNGNADPARIGIGGYFVACVSARDAGVAKPHRRIFDQAAQRLGVPPAAVLHVGDDGALDVLGGLAAGMQTVWVNRERQDWAHAQDPHATVDGLLALCRLLQL